MNLDKLTTDLEYIKELREWFKSVAISPSQGLNSDGVPFKEGKDEAHLISRIKSAILATGDKIIAEQQDLVKETIRNEVIGEVATEGLEKCIKSVQGNTGVIFDDNEKEPDVRLHPEDAEKLSEPKSLQITRAVCEIVTKHIKGDKPIYSTIGQVIDQPVLTLVKERFLNSILKEVKKLILIERHDRFEAEFIIMFTGREGNSIKVRDLCDLVKEYL